MKRLVTNLVIFTILIFASTSSKGAIVKPWTVFVYIAAANDLNPYALRDLREMMQVGSSPYLNIVVYLTIQEDGKSKQTKKLYVEKGQLSQIGPVMERDSGDVATFTEALQWACLDYPSDRMAVVLWDHGSGPLNRRQSLNRGICYDYDTGHYLTDRDCLDALSWACEKVRGGKKFDIVACDACLLASLEMAYTFASCADYFVASEETIPGNGFQYAYLLNKLSLQSLDTLSFVKLMVSSYEKEYLGTLNYTLSAIDLNIVNQLTHNVNVVAQILSSNLKGKNSSASRTTIKKSIKSCISFDNGIYIDLCMFYKNILKNISQLKLPKVVTQQFKRTLMTGIDLFSTAVKAQVTSRNYKQVGGLSMYFSRYAIEPSYYGLYWTEKNPNWLNFLESYLA